MRVRLDQSIKIDLFNAVVFSKNQLEGVFDHLEPMCLVDKELKIIRLNRALVTFISKTYKDCLERKIEDAFSDWDYDLIVSNIKLAFSYRRSIQVNDYSIIENGKKGWYEITFYPVINEDKSVDECVVYFKNVTELFLTKKILYQQYKKLEEQQLTVEKQHIKLLETKNALDKVYQSLKEESKVARDVQQGIMPTELPEIRGVGFSSSYEPISDVGGDIFDILELSPSKIGVFIGDVSGHGLPAAFVGAMVKMALIDHAKEEVSPKELFTTINDSLCQNLKSGHYLTAFYGVYDLQTQVLHYGKASHPQPLLIRKNGDVLKLDTHGMFLGLLEEPEYEEKEIQLNQGDRIYFFTDGYFEIKGESGKRLMYDELCEMLIRLNHLSLDEVHQKLIVQLGEFIGKASLHDDRTFLAMEITGPREQYALDFFTSKDLEDKKGIDRKEK